MEALLDSYGLFAVFGIMLLKECGVPVPIPGDVIMLGVAAHSAQGKFPLELAFGALLVPMLIGGLVQYLVSRGAGRKVIARFGRYIGLTDARLEKVMSRMRKGGSTAVALGLNTPGVRIATNPASGLANLLPRQYLPGLALGNFIWLGWHFAIGYVGGVALNALNISTPVLAVVVVFVLALGLFAAFVSRRRKKSATATYAQWAESSCPVCAAMTLLENKEDILVI
jgi:membrane protein DedA with SNARE-associated domain